MANYTYTPSGPLSPFVERIYYSDDYSPPPGKERVLPAATSQFILNLGHPHFRHYSNTDENGEQVDGHTIIVGGRTEHLFLDPQTRLATVGVVFKPAGLCAFLGYPADEFLNHSLTLSDILTVDINALRQQILEVPTPKGRLQLLESFLVDQIDHTYRASPAAHYTWKILTNNSGNQTISAIADNVGYSRRRLTDLFRELVGMSPKTYARIQRFQKALSLIRKASKPNWSRIALDCGYYDQAHFNREFKALSELTPSRYFHHKTDKTNHLPV